MVVKSLGSQLRGHAIQSNLSAMKSGSWLGRIKTPQREPRVVLLSEGKLKDLSECGVWSVGYVLQQKDPLNWLKSKQSQASFLDYPLEKILENSISRIGSPDPPQKSIPTFLSPHDLSSMKAAGVVFVKSLLERVVEEQAKGDPTKAHHIREELSSLIGKQLDKVKPGSKEALQLLHILTEEKGVSRHYLEVGLGEDAELFTKAQPMSSIGFGSQLGINPRSNWNNPEPEVVVVSNRFGQIVGCTLGNDVNLRDWEGRSALLLGRAKDVNGSCVIGPMIRLIDEKFTLEDIRKTDIELEIYGEEDGFSLKDGSSLREIGRDITDLVGQAFKAHQYPDGLFLMTGTMFAPVVDRDVGNPKGFTHKVGDHVLIGSKQLGALYNLVNSSEEIPQWDFGAVDLIQGILAKYH